MAKRREVDLRHGWRRRKADSRHMRVDWIRSQPGVVYFGGESVTLSRQKIKYVRPGRYGFFTAGELARIYLDDLIRDQLHDTRIPDHWKMTPDDERKLAIQAPLYFDPSRGRDGRFVYIDIAACYFELMKGWPLNVGYNLETGKTYMPRPELRIPERDWDWLRSEKPLRHAIFGMLNAADIGWYKDGVWVHHKSLGRYACPDLVALVKTQLRQIAREAVEMGCLMWLTDAAIFTDYSKYLIYPPAERFQGWLQTVHGLTGHVKAQGHGHLYQQGGYRIGRTQTAKATHVDLPGWSNL